EYMKPDFPDVNAALAEWVQKGGVLIYVGDGFDPYHGIRSWWTGKYRNPAEHLFSLLGVTLPADRAISAVGSGFVGVWNVNPVTLGFKKEGSDGLRAFVREAASRKGLSIPFKNYLDLRRGNLIISACLEHSVTDEPKVYTGRFADMFTPDFALTNEKRVAPGERSVLFDLDTVADQDLAVIGTSVRFLSMTDDRAAKTVTAQVRGIAGIRAAVRLKVPFAVTAADVDGAPCTVAYDADSQTVLLRFPNTQGEHTLTVRG
ncbi:MAG: hypothetical protein II738_02725, partial [Clostridia bacterium]|nr:hypothetical protein [Clostridia bacterium]